MSQQSIVLSDTVVRAPVLGFGCSAMMGRVGRKASLAALAAAFDSGVLFYDTARSYGYGESEALLGEFLQGRRDRVWVSTKFGILPSATSPLKRALKPIARTLLRVAPGARKSMQRRLSAMSSTGHFSIAALQQSLHESLRALRTDYVDFLFLHEPPAGVLEQEELFAALGRLVAEGKILRFGIAASMDVIDAAMSHRIPGLQSVQFPSNLFSMRAPVPWSNAEPDLIAIANHPFGGAAGIAAGKALLARISVQGDAPADLREKLTRMDDGVLADVVLNAITRDTGVHIVVASMLRLDHLRANVSAMQRSRFSADELEWLRAAISAV